jgi:uncharacterized protein YutE (UPF0331/DUF86 family)
MVTPTVSIERERLLKLAEDYRVKGYEVSLDPSFDDLPDFLKQYHLDMVVRRGDESVAVAVTSRSSLNSSSDRYLRNLAQAIEQHSGWRFELVMMNPDDIAYSRQAEESFQYAEIASRLPVAKQLITQHIESAFLYSWSLVEATLRLVVKNEGLSLQKFSPLYLVKQLVMEGVISKSEYQLLMNAISLRNAIVHGFKTTQQITKESVGELIDLIEQLLKTLRPEEEPG